MLRRKKREDILKEIYDELFDALCRKDEDISLRFVCEHDIKKVWTQERIAKISTSYKWAKEQKRVQDNFLKVLSTLVWIHWDGWKSFGELFLDIPNRSDNDLPLQDITFLGSGAFSDAFTAWQHIFTPVILKEDDTVPNLSADYPNYSKHHRLPILSSKRIGHGSSGSVTKEEIAPGYFKYKGGHDNKKSLFVAVKRFVRSQSNPEDFKIEHHNLKSFKECLTKNDNIMLSLTTFAHSDQFIIISPLADLDLQKFFEGKYEGIEERCRNFTPMALLEESKCLANALNFLHYGLQTRNKKIACAHLDLKPENILVEWGSSGNYPVGCWKIHDFGTARIKESSTEAQGSAPENLQVPGDFVRQFSLTVARRAPGTFQAPEVQSTRERLVGRESDMWSYGCILAFVLAFATGGPSNVEKLQEARFQKDSDGKTRDLFYITEESGNKKIKPSVKAWLEKLQPDNQNGRSWESKVLKLIFDLLKIRPGERLKASQVSDALENICSGGFSQLKNPVPRVVSVGNSIFDEDNANALHIQLNNGAPTSPSTTKDTILSSNSSISSQRLGLTDEISFIKLKVPKDTLKSAICPTGSHVAFLSKRSVVVHSIADQVAWGPRSKKLAPVHSTASPIECHHGYEWNYISISGSYAVLRSKEQRGERETIHQYHFDVNNSPKWGVVHWVNGDAPINIHVTAGKSLHLVVSCRGDVLFIGNEKLYYYSSERGVTELQITGQLQRCGASFSTDGKFIYVWSYDLEVHVNYWYRWATGSCALLNEGSSKLRIVSLSHFLFLEAYSMIAKCKQPENGNGRDTVFPLSNYFAAFERPDRIHIIGKRVEKFGAVKLKRTFNNIVAGASYQSSDSADEALILVSPNVSLILLQLLPNTADSLLSDYELKIHFDQLKDVISVLKQQDGSAFVVIARSNGLLLRRKISITYLT